MENEWFKCMRDLTPEEQALVNEQIRKISNPTGVTLEGILNGETYIPRSQIDKVIEEIEKVAEEESFDSRKWSQGLRYSIKIIRKYCDVPETNVGNMKKEKE